MKPEIEAKFINININEVRQNLQAAGAICEQPMRLMRRALVETPELTAVSAFLRLRDEGDKVTLTYKQFHGNSVHSASEHEVIVGDYHIMADILSAMGHEFTTKQESRRETWKLNNVEVVIDEWPWINPYIEIEGETEMAVREAAELLGYNWVDAMFGSADVVYNLEYPKMSVRGVIDIKEVRFGDPVPAEFLG